MEKNKIDQFMMINGEKFPQTAVLDIKKKLEELDDDQASLLISTEWKSPTVGFLCAFFGGGLGIDRFWLGEVGLGIAKVLTCAGVGIWGIVDWFTAGERTKKYNYNKFLTLF